MKIVTVTATLVVGIASSALGSVQADYADPLLQKKQEFARCIYHALSEADLETRDMKVQSLLEEYLLNDDTDTFAATYTFLSTNSRKIDLSPWKESVLRLDQLHPYKPGSVLLSKMRFERDSCDQRIEILRKAIVDGSVTLPGGYRVTEYTAVKEVVEGGIDSLFQMILERYEELSTSTKKHYPMEYLRAKMELLGGACDRDSALKRAAINLDKISEEALERRMDSETEFRRAALEIVSASCELDPLSGEYCGDCILISQVVRRQIEFLGPDKTLRDSGAPDWLVGMGIATSPVREENDLHIGGSRTN